MSEEVKVVLDYGQIINIIGDEVQLVWRALKENEATSEMISNIKSIEISDEQSFIRKDRDKGLLQGTVYVVVKFGSGSINFGSSVTPITILCVGTSNKVRPAQLLLGTFASQWTTKNMASGQLQVWNTPEIITNFNEIDADFKNLFRLTGFVILGPAAVRVGTITYYYDHNNVDDEHSETISMMSVQDGYHASLDAQPFGNTHGFVKSEVNFSTYTFSFSTYLLAGHLANDMLAVRGFRYRPNGTYFNPNMEDPEQVEEYNKNFSSFQPNDEIWLKIQFDNGYNNFPGPGEDQIDNDDPVTNSSFFYKFKLVDSKISQELAGLPTLVVTLTR